MSAEYALQFARERDPDLLTVRLQTSPRRYVAVTRSMAKEHFPHSVSQVANKQWGEPSDYQSAEMAVSSDVHRAVEAQLMGFPGAYNVGTQEAANSLAAFDAWWRVVSAVGNRMLAAEAFVWSRPMGCAGTLDFLYGRPDWHCMVDFKALAAPAGRVLPSWKLQLAGYSQLLEQLGHPPINTGVLLVLPKDGSPWQEFTVWSTVEAKLRLQNAFLQALRMRTDLDWMRKMECPVRVGAAVTEWDLGWTA